MSSVSNLFENKTQKSQAIVISKFIILFSKKIKKFMDLEFFITISTYTISCK